MDERESKQKKQLPLRLTAGLYAQLAAWAEEDFRSVNGQIEYLLTECVKWRRGEGRRNETANGGEDRPVRAGPEDGGE